MAVNINHDLRRVDGKTLFMPAWFQGELGWGNLKLPNVYRADGATQQYPAGTKYVDGERAFYYSQFIGQISGTEWVAALQAPNSTALTVTQGRFLFAHVFQQDYANGLMVRHTADELSIVFQTTTSEAQADDYYSGGWVNGKDTGDNNRPFYRYITKHDYASAGSSAQRIWNTSSESFITVDLSSYSDVSVLELDQSVVTSKSTMATTIMPNPWKHLIYKTHSEVNQYAPAMGAVVPNAVDQNDWCWVQTWGPMGIPWAFVEFAGADTGEVMYKISGDGSTSPQHSGAPAPADGSTWQVAGLSMASTIMESASGQDEERVMMYLMLRP
ncbi:hypothetical protein LCGC14_2200540 [marine sediment metagenome]|uniref:Uncharacterized protein n=1 Tax=marine sediment metagenome TaxID=412755 RepID=A0A0F9DH37_9ZZZZ